MEWLKAIRKEQKMSQAHVAELANITQPSYTNIENGKRSPSVATAKAIASTLGFDWTRFYECGIPDGSATKQTKEES